MASPKVRDLKDRIVSICRLFDIPPPVTEYRFHPTRRWRFDCAWPEYKVAVEVHGGGFVQGRHNRPLGMTADFEKQRESVFEGWIVLYYTGLDLSESSVETRANEIKRLLEIGKDNKTR